MTAHALDVDQQRLLASVKPRTANQLHAWLTAALKIDVPRRALIAGNHPPFDYLCHAFFEPGESAADEVRDCVVWAARGSGKTFYAAVATALDLAFKPGIEVRLLGGSREQSQRMHRHLRELFQRPVLAPLLAEGPGKAITESRLTLGSGSRAEILAQSHTSVRGVRPQKLRCDEAELFDPDVWDAAQLVTRSARCGTERVAGAVEALSTWHRPGGLMQRLVDSCGVQRDHETGEDMTATRRLFRWGVVDVLEHCAPERPCATCALQPECDGRAKSGGGVGAVGAAAPTRRVAGHLTISDALRLKRRVDAATWDAEMLCRRPVRSSAVFPEFDVSRHVSAEMPTDDDADVLRLVGMDFGFRAPTAIVFAALDSDNVLHITHERHATGVVVREHAQAIAAMPMAAPAWVGVDPAGRQRSDQTGRSAIAVLKEEGLTVRARPSAIELGVRLIRARLAPATGEPTLRIHPRCTTLIDALRAYHYPEHNPESTTPAKDGPDHAVDALRYLIVNLDTPYRSTVRRYI